MSKHDLKISKRQEMQAGITLVALVITVVVMLILAGVAIAAVVDGDGLFSKTREAKEVYENASDRESEMLTNLMGQIDYYIKDSEDAPIENPLNQIVNVNQTYSGGTEGSYSDPIIPKGFKPVENEQDNTITQGAVWGSSEGYKYGLVIEDESGNQFVWVPVDGTTVKFERYDFGKDSLFSSCSEIVPEEILTSVTTNEGFYIARYEAGLKSEEDLSSVEKDGSVKPISKQGATVWNSIAWSEDNNNDDTNPGDGAVTVARAMYPVDDTNYGAISTLIYGTQWDATLKFIGAYNVGEAGYDTYATDSTGMGNYNGTSEGDATTDETTTCGLVDAFRQKNIYDMAGNVYEWTMEKYSTYRVGRGGSYSTSGLDNPASYRGSGKVDGVDSDFRFSCSTLYKAILSPKEGRIS